MELTLKRKIFSRYKLLQIVKFGIAGALGLLIDFAITWLCKERLGWNFYLANVAGFLLAVTNNYFINRHWAFASNSKNIGVQFTKFLLVSAIGILLNTACIYMLHQLASIGFSSSKFIAIIIVFLWNYFANAAEEAAVSYLDRIGPCIVLNCLIYIGVLLPM